MRNTGHTEAGKADTMAGGAVNAARIALRAKAARDRAAWLALAAQRAVRRETEAYGAVCRAGESTADAVDAVRHAWLAAHVATEALLATGHRVAVAAAVDGGTATLGLRLRRKDV